MTGAPRSIRIGAHDVSVHFSARPPGTGAMGRYEPADQNIWVADDMPASQIAEITLHEALHAVVEGAGIVRCDDEITAERAVHLCAAGFTQIMRDNPDLVRWVMVQLRPEDA